MLGQGVAFAPRAKPVKPSVKPNGSQSHGPTIQFVKPLVCEVLLSNVVVFLGYPGAIDFIMVLIKDCHLGVYPIHFEPCQCGSLMPI